MTRKPKLALMCKSENFKRVKNTDLYVSGHWVICAENQELLLGENVIFTKGQKDKAYLGGQIVGFLPSEKTNRLTKCKVVFTPDDSLIGCILSISSMFNWCMGMGWF
jgi:hypothetical protein